MGKGKKILVTGFCRETPLFWAVFAIFLTFTPVSRADLISTDITVDGNFTDWNAVLANTLPQQYADDPEGVASGTDRDRAVQSTGRDLKKFAYTWNATDLFFYVERWGSTRNRNWWWFYLDLDANGRMESTDKVLLVEWFGANQLTNTILYNYVPSTGSDPLVCESAASCSAPGAVGFADGYDMPGGISGGTTLYSGVIGGSLDGVRLEARMPWSSLGSGLGPRPLGFHISSSNGTNLPGQIDDNMDGPGGNFMFVDNVDLGVQKTSNAVPVDGIPQAAGNSQFTYTVTVTNTSGPVVGGVRLTDILPSQVTLITATPSQGAYASDVWTIGALDAGAMATLTLLVSVNNPPNTGSPTLPITVTNTANNLSLLGYDTNAANNQASTSVTLHPAPTLVVTKTSSVVDDSLTGPAGQEFAVPGALIEYRVVLQNTSTFATGQSVVITDPLPIQTDYVVGSTRIQVDAGPAVPQTDIADGVDDTQYDGVTKNLIVGPRTVNVNSTTTVTFQVRLN